MIVRFDSFEELLEWYGNTYAYTPVAYRFSGTRGGEGPSTSSAHSMFQNIKDDRIANLDGFSKGEYLEILY